MRAARSGEAAHARDRPARRAAPGLALIDDNRRANVLSEVARGDDTLESAELLLQAKKAADAVSRAYYAAFHYARALLLSLGEDPITHAGVEKLLHRHWVKSGELDAEVARRFSKLQKMRIDADYSAEEGAVALEYVHAARTLLTRRGWLSSPPSS
jgi:uncharacterized protein (UPF0332 family)